MSNTQAQEQPRGEQGEARQVAEVAKVSLTFKYDDFCRLQKLAPDGDVSALLSHALNVYESMAEMAAQGFTTLVLRNEKANAEARLDGNIFFSE